MDLRAVRFARSLALASASISSVLACGGAQSTSATPKPAPSTSASADQASTSERTTSSDGAKDGPSDSPKDGPCRCSWDTNAQAAPRVCKRGEANYDGTACVPGGGYNPKYPPPVLGPLPARELRARRGRARRARR